MNRYEFYGNINTYRKNQTNKENELTHYGTLGQKWGVRKWQNYDGTFNEAGKERYFGTGKFKSVSKEEQKSENNKFAKEYLDRKNIKYRHEMFDQIMKNNPDFKKLTEEYWKKEKDFRNDAVKNGSVNSFEHVKLMNDYYDKLVDLAEKEYGLKESDKYDFAFHTQGISEEKMHDDSKFKDINKLPRNDTEEDYKNFQEYIKQRREQKDLNQDQKIVFKEE